MCRLTCIMRGHIINTYTRTCMPIEIAKDNFTGELHLLGKWEYENCNFELIEEAGEFSPDECACWATEINGERFTGGPLLRGLVRTERPHWATHIVWFDE